MRKDSAYLGHETFSTGIRMWVKMSLKVVLLAFFSGLPLTALIFLVSSTNRFRTHDFFSQLHNAWLLFWTKRATYLDLEHYVFVRWIPAFWAFIRSYVMVLFACAVVAAVFWVWFFKYRARGQAADQHIRGPRMLSGEEHNRKIKKGMKKFIKGVLRLGGISVSPKMETEHFLVVGGAGAGKTTSVQGPVIAHHMEKGSRGLILDTKTDFTSRFLNFEKAKYDNMLFCPLDERTVGWTLMNDIKDVSDIERVAYRLIPPGLTSDPTWSDGAREILIGLLHYARREGLTKNSDLWELFTNTSPKKKFKILSSISAGRAGAERLNPDAARTAAGYHGNFVGRVRPLEYLPDGDFSVNDWVENGTGFIFCLNTFNLSDLIRPVLSVFVEMVAARLLSLEDNDDRRLFFFLDEFSELAPQDAVIKLITKARSKGASCWLGLQELGQLLSLYKEGSRSIIGSCGTSVIFRIRDVETAKYFSDQIGEHEFYEFSKSISTGVDDFRDGIALRQDRRDTLLVKPSQIQNLEGHSAYILTSHGVSLNEMKVGRMWLKEKDRENIQPGFILRKGLRLDDLYGAQAELITSTWQGPGGAGEEEYKVEQEKQNMPSSDAHNFDF